MYWSVIHFVDVADQRQFIQVSSLLPVYWVYLGNHQTVLDPGPVLAWIGKVCTLKQGCVVLD